jgi:DNA-directed RNA polymerase specialized sigma24 family protein
MNYMYDKWSDESILELIREQHDELAFEVLYNRYFKPLFNYAYSKVHDQFVAQEIIQELFVNLWQQRDRIQADCCRSLLFTMAKRRVISFYRKEFTRRHHYDQWTIHQPEYEVSTGIGPRTPLSVWLAFASAEMPGSICSEPSGFCEQAYCGTAFDFRKDC